MHDFDGVICVFLAFELYEAVALMLIGDFVSGDVDVDDWTALGEEFPEETLVDFGVDVAGVDCGLLVAFVEGGNQGHYSYNYKQCLSVETIQY